MTALVRVSWIAIGVAVYVAVAGIAMSMLVSNEGVAGGLMTALFFSLPLLLMGLALRNGGKGYRAAAALLAVLLFAFVAMAVLGNWASYSSSQALFVLLTMAPTAVACLLVLWAAFLHRPDRPRPPEPTTAERERHATRTMRGVALTWVAAAVVAALLGAFIFGLGERPVDRIQGSILVLGALLAVVSAVLAALRPSRGLAQAFVILAGTWVATAAVVSPALLFASDRVLFVWFPTLFPVIAGLVSLSRALGRVPRKPGETTPAADAPQP